MLVFFVLSLPTNTQFIEFMTIKEFFSFKKNRIFWLNILGMVVFVLVVIYGALKGIDLYTHHGESISVPNVQGMTSQKAVQTLTASQLEPAIVDSCYAPDMPQGSVVDQKPIPGARVKQGRQVYLTICTHRTPTRVIPDVIDNSSLREAQARILAAGFQLTENAYISGEKDWVYGVRYRGANLRPGDKVPVGAALTLVVGGHAEVAVSDSLDVDMNENENTPAEADAPAREDESWF